MLNYDSFDVLTFDCYGTLIDWRSGILSALKPVLAEYEVVLADDELLGLYNDLESERERQPYRSYRDILRQIVSRIADRYGIEPSAAQLEAPAESLSDWPPFNDTVEALRALKTKYQLGIISNIDDDLFAGTNRRLQVEFDYIITAQQVKAYKPSLLVFEYALEKIALPKEKILHVAQSLYHDHAPAKQLGLATVWINRQRLVPGTAEIGSARPDAEFLDLASLAKAAGL